MSAAIPTRYSTTPDWIELDDPAAICVGCGEFFDACYCDAISRAELFEEES